MTKKRDYKIVQRKWNGEQHFAFTPSEHALLLKIVDGTRNSPRPHPLATQLSDVLRRAVKTATGYTTGLSHADAVALQQFIVNQLMGAATFSHDERGLAQNISLKIHNRTVAEVKVFNRGRRK